MIESDPPLLHHYGTLVHNTSNLAEVDQQRHVGGLVFTAEECQLPFIDLNGLKSPDTRESLECARAICRASSEWGFFQVLNHGISPELLQSMRREQLKLFAAPFERKANCGLLNNSYRWGTPTATRPTQYSWSEAFHIPVAKISEEACYGEDFGSLRYFFFLFCFYYIFLFWCSCLIFKALFFPLNLSICQCHTSNLMNLIISKSILNVSHI